MFKTQSPNHAARIEAAIQSRSHEQAHRLIQSFLRAEKNTPEARLAASEYYRRLSDYGKALRVLKLDVHPSGWKKTSEKTGDKASETETEIQLQAVRILNLLGASSYALQIIEKLPRASREKHGLRIAPVLMANYRYDEALTYLEPLLGTKDADLDYSGRLKLLSLSDCYCGLKRFDEARSVVERVLACTRERLLEAIARQAYGSYCILEGRIDDGGAALLKSEKLFDASDRTPDHGFLLKWLGAYYVRKGKLDTAADYLSRAWEILYRPGFKPEAWLDVLYWTGLVKLREHKASAVPAEWLRILSFPGPGNPLAERMKKEIELPGSIVLSRAAAPAKLGPVHLDLLSDVKTVERKGAAVDATRARHALGLSVSDRLHALLICSGPYGVPQFRAYEYLWPDAVLAFHQHQKRLEQAVSKLRSEKAEVSWKDFHLMLAQGDRATCRWSARAPVPGLVFLEAAREFRRGDVERFFSISMRSANGILQQWGKSGLVAAEGKGPSRRYRPLVKAEGST